MSYKEGEGKKVAIKMPEAEGRGSEQNLVSSTNMGEENNIVIVEESSDPHSITGILNVCKKKLLKPYMRFLGAMGLRPIFGDYVQPQAVANILNFGYVMQVIFFLILGYFLQYASCFRRDRGFGRLPLFTGTQLTAIYNETCNGSLGSSYIIPSVLHFSGYLCALVVFRKSDDNQLPVLMERVFLTMSHVPNMQINQRHIVRTLWFFVIGSFIWMLSSIAIVNYLMSEGEITFKWINHSSDAIQVTLKILLIMCIIWHDIVQASVISNYCLQAQLLKSYVHFLREKLLQQSVSPLDWIRDIEECRKLMNYLNEQTAPAVCIFSIINWTYAISGSLWLLLSHQDVTNNGLPLSTAVNILNVILWWIIAVAPFVQAARLTSACDNVKTAGQEVRTRPFLHQDTSVHELNSILIYTTSLKINAKLFRLPITGKYIGISFAALAVFVLVLGQSHFIRS